MTQQGHKLSHDLCAWMSNPEICGLSQTSQSFRHMRNYRTRVVLSSGYPVHELGLLYQGLEEVRLRDVQVMERSSALHTLRSFTLQEWEVHLLLYPIRLYLTRR